MRVATPFLIGGFLLLGFAAIASAQAPEGPVGELLRTPDGSFIGASSAGGDATYGTLVRLSAETVTEALVSFGEDTTPKGAFPRAGLVAGGGGSLWGTTQQGGSAGLGTVFKFFPATRRLVTVAEFTGANGTRPEAALARDVAGNLWGTTSAGGANGLGTVFTINETAGALTTLVSFTGTSGLFPGSAPRAALHIDGAGVVWGTTSTGGAGDLGTIFKIDGNTFTSVLAFTGTTGAAPGSVPEAALIPFGGKLWGTTRRGGAADLGTIFSFTPTTGALSSLHSFTGENGAEPRARLAVDGNRLLGTASTGGASGDGIVFGYDPATNAFDPIHHFTGSIGLGRGAQPLGGLTPDGLGSFFGSTARGGSDDHGAFYKLTGRALFTVAETVVPRGPKPPTATPPSPSTTTGSPGDTVELKGTVRLADTPVTVLISINGGPFVPATITPDPNPARPAKWNLTVTPENGTNVVIIRVVDPEGKSSPPKTLTFEYKISRPLVAGTYAGLATPDAALTTPLSGMGSVSLKVTPQGRFTGKILLGGRTTIGFKGAFGNAGDARFGKTGTAQLLVPRKNNKPLELDLTLGLAAADTGILTGAITENGAPLATIRAAQALYTAKKNPVAPLRNVPMSLLDPLTERGAYTALLRAPGGAAFPVGDGFALLRLSTAGRVKLAGKLADGTPFSFAAPLTGGDNRLPLFVPLYAKAGALGGEITFREQAGESDADGVGIAWVRPANSKAASFRAGWPGGIRSDFVASKFLKSAANLRTALGNAPSAGADNATLTLTGADYAGPQGNLLALSSTASAGILGAAPGATTATGLKAALSAKGLVTGSFVSPTTQLTTSFFGAVFQKTQTAAGYFLAAPPKGSPRPLPEQLSGRVEIGGR